METWQTTNPRSFKYLLLTLFALCTVGMVVLIFAFVVFVKMRLPFAGPPLAMLFSIFAMALLFRITTRAEAARKRGVIDLAVRRWERIAFCILPVLCCATALTTVF